MAIYVPQPSQRPVFYRVECESQLRPMRVHNAYGEPLPDSAPLMVYHPVFEQHRSPPSDRTFEKDWRTKAVIEYLRRQVRVPPFHLCLCS